VLGWPCSYVPAAECILIHFETIEQFHITESHHFAHLLIVACCPCLEKTALVICQRKDVRGIVGDRNVSNGIDICLIPLHQYAVYFTLWRISQNFITDEYKCIQSGALGLEEAGIAVVDSVLIAHKREVRSVVLRREACVAMPKRGELGDLFEVGLIPVVDHEDVEPVHRK